MRFTDLKTEIRLQNWKLLLVIDIYWPLVIAKYKMCFIIVSGQFQQFCKGFFVSFQKLNFQNMYIKKIEV